MRLMNLAGISILALGCSTPVWGTVRGRIENRDLHTPYTLNDDLDHGQLLLVSSSSVDLKGQVDNGSDIRIEADGNVYINKFDHHSKGVIISKGTVTINAISNGIILFIQAKKVVITDKIDWGSLVSIDTEDLNIKNINSGDTRVTVCATGTRVIQHQDLPVNVQAPLGSCPIPMPSSL